MIKETTDISVSYDKKKEIEFLSLLNTSKIRSNLNSIGEYERKIKNMRKENNRLYQSNDWLSKL